MRSADIVLAVYHPVARRLGLWLVVVVAAIAKAQWVQRRIEYLPLISAPPCCAFGQCHVPFPSIQPCASIRNSLVALVSQIYDKPIGGSILY